MCPDGRLSGDTEQKLASDLAIGTQTVGTAGDDAGFAIKNHPGGPRDSSGAARGDNCPAERAGLAGTGTLMAQPDAVGLSDTRLGQSAASALAQNALVPAGRVRIVVRNGWLLLDGEVETRVQRQAAEDAIKGLPGIRGVSNNILIEIEVMAQRVGQKIEEAFIRSARLNANRISVTASADKIVLCGSVHSGIERAEAEAAAWAVPGVSHVINRLRTIP